MAKGRSPWTFPDLTRGKWQLTAENKYALCAVIVDPVMPIFPKK